MPRARRRAATEPIAAGGWYERHADQYDRRHPGAAGDLAFYVALAQQYGGPVLELGCGHGRVARAIAATGTHVVGLDRSPAMLRSARAQTEPALRIDWLAGDLRRFAFAGRFPLIIAPYRTLQHTADTAELGATIACCARHLTPTGTLAFDLTNAAALDRLATGRQPLRQQRVEPGLTLRAISATEVDACLGVAGLSGAVFGSFELAPFDAASDPTQIWLARPVPPGRKAEGG